MSTNATSHRIRSISVIGGFLDGAQFDLADGLNCFIGARGTGKTTALEFVRYALDALPVREHQPTERRRIESLVERNLAGGRVEVTIETKDGLSYIISRSAGEEPIVLTAERQPTDITFQGGRRVSRRYLQPERSRVHRRPHHVAARAARQLRGRADRRDRIAPRPCACVAHRQCQSDRAVADTDRDSDRGAGHAGERRGAAQEVRSGRRAGCGHDQPGPPPEGNARSRAADRRHRHPGIAGSRRGFVGHEGPARPPGSQPAGQGRRHRPQRGHRRKRF